MNKFFLPALLLLPATLLAQQRTDRSLAFSYDNVSVGRNVNVTYHQSFLRKWRFYAGLKYHINSKYFRNDYTITTYLYKAFYVRKSLEHFGLKLGLERTLYSKDAFEFFGYYDFQFTRATVIGFQYNWELGEFPTVIPSWRHSEDLFNAYEQTLGIGLRLKVNDKFWLRLQAGMGINVYKMAGTTGYLPKDLWHLNNDWTFSRQFTLGAEYALGKTSTAKGHKASRRKATKEEEPYNSLGLAYNDVQTGGSISLNYNYALTSGIRLYAGLKYHINNIFYRDYTITQPYYFKQFRPENFLEHIGITLGLEKVFTLPGHNLEPFAFYEFQGMRSTVSNLVNLWNANLGTGLTKDPRNGWPNEGNDDYSNPTFRKYGPVIALENYVGLGVRIGITEQFNFKMKGGIGYNIYIGPDHFQDYGIYHGRNSNGLLYSWHEDVPWTAQKSEISRMFSLGLEYKLLRRGK